MSQAIVGLALFAVRSHEGLLQCEGVYKKVASITPIQVLAITKLAFTYIGVIMRLANAYIADPILAIISSSMLLTTAAINIAQYSTAHVISQQKRRREAVQWVTRKLVPREVANTLDMTAGLLECFVDGIDATGHMHGMHGFEEESNTLHPSRSTSKDQSNACELTQSSYTVQPMSPPERGNILESNVSASRLAGFNRLALMEPGSQAGEARGGGTLLLGKGKHSRNSYLQGAARASPPATANKDDVWLEVTQAGQTFVRALKRAAHAIDYARKSSREGGTVTAEARVLAAASSCLWRTVTQQHRRNHSSTGSTWHDAKHPEWRFGLDHSNALAQYARQSLRQQGMTSSQQDEASDAGQTQRHKDAELLMRKHANDGKAAAGDQGWLRDLVPTREPAEGTAGSIKLPHAAGMVDGVSARQGWMDFLDSYEKWSAAAGPAGEELAIRWAQQALTNVAGAAMITGSGLSIAAQTINFEGARQVLDNSTSVEARRQQGIVANSLTMAYFIIWVVASIVALGTNPSPTAVDIATEVLSGVVQGLGIGAASLALFFLTTEPTPFKAQLQKESWGRVVAALRNHTTAKDIHQVLDSAFLAAQQLATTYFANNTNG